MLWKSILLIKVNVFWQNAKDLLGNITFENHVSELLAPHESASRAQTSEKSDYSAVSVM